MTDTGRRAEVETRASGASSDAATAALVDTHCHLFLIEDDPSAVVEGARGAGVETLVCVGIDPESSVRSLELAESFRGVFATAGMHPHTASDLDVAAERAIEELLGSPLVVGVGETGLDFYRMRSPREDQERAFRMHIGLSRESDRPLVVHVREAWPEAMAILDEERAERVVLHCFTGDAAIAREAGDRGYFLSFSGNVTYPRNDDIRNAAAAAPGDRVVVETDSPFLAPQRIRGRDNRPEGVRDVVEELARARGEPVENLRAMTSENARSAFPGLR
jgi:TatD DNase family protein